MDGQLGSPKLRVVVRWQRFCLFDVRSAETLKPS